MSRGTLAGRLPDSTRSADCKDEAGCWIERNTCHIESAGPAGVCQEQMWRPHCACSSTHSHKSTPVRRCPKTRLHTCSTVITDANLSMCTVLYGWKMPARTTFGTSLCNKLMPGQRVYWAQRHEPRKVDERYSAMLARHCMQLHVQRLLQQVAPEVCLSKCLRPSTIASCTGRHGVHNVPWRGFYSRISSILHHARSTFAAVEAVHL